MFEENFFENYTPIYANFDHIDAMSDEEAAEALIEIVSGLFGEAVADLEGEFNFALTQDFLLNPTRDRFRRYGPYNTKLCLKKIALAQEFGCLTTNVMKREARPRSAVDESYVFSVAGVPVMSSDDEDCRYEERSILVFRNFGYSTASRPAAYHRIVHVNTYDFFEGLDISDAIHCGRLASRQTVHLRGTIDEVHRDLRMIYLDRSLNFMRR